MRRIALPSTPHVPISRPAVLLWTDITAIPLYCSQLSKRFSLSLPASFNAVAASFRPKLYRSIRAPRGSGRWIGRFLLRYPGERRLVRKAKVVPGWCAKAALATCPVTGQSGCLIAQISPNFFAEQNVKLGRRTSTASPIVHKHVFEGHRDTLADAG